MENKVFDLERYAEKARETVAEGVVLLRNEGAILPLPADEKVAVFGRSQFNYYKSGTGSGGLVNTRYVVGVWEALEKSSFVLNRQVRSCYEQWLKDHPYDFGAGWAKEPWVQEEMPLAGELVRSAREESDTAIVLIGRTAGEDQDNKAEAGSYLLTETEKDMLKKVCTVFEKTVVLLNVGNIIDMKWVEDYQPAAVMYIWQGGQEGGNGVLDVLNGTVSPSGKLTDTIAKNIEDYPSTRNHGDELRNLYEEDVYVGYRYFETFAQDRVLYPFGFGLSYTTFKLEDARITGTVGTDPVKVDVKVTNTGAVTGKEVVQVYVQAPQGALGKPARVLCGFAKTDRLAPATSQKIAIEFPWYRAASYDDSGVTGHKSCYVLESGTYQFFVGTDVRSAFCAGEIVLKETVILSRQEEAMAPVLAFKRMKPEISADGRCHVSYEDVPTRTVEPSAKRLENLPVSVPCTGNKGYKLSDVKDGKVSMEAFLAQLDDVDLFCIVRGEGMSSPKVTPGTAGAFGGVTDRLLRFGIPIACCADGPSGIRMDCGSIAFAMPNGACLASTFNETLSEELYEWEGLELRKNKVDTLLGPGINIHRNPLNGRNFEYFSEDPLLTGRMAAAQLRGMGRYGVTGTIKHFACNTQEFKRRTAEAVVSERALREIYLKGFEIAVREGGACSIMTSYNPINGFWSASNYDMLTRILRNEWGYDGIVMTDWWAEGNDEGAIGDVKNIAAMVRAQNDLFMVVENAGANSMEDNSADSMAKGIVTRGEYLRSAANICRFLLRTPAFTRMQGVESELDKALAACALEEPDAFNCIVRLTMENGGALPLEDLKTDKGTSTLFEVIMGEKRAYRMVITCRVPNQGSLAQIPLTISQDKQVMRTISLTGEDKEWRQETVELTPPVRNRNIIFLKFYFGQSGMEIREVKLEPR